MRARRLGVWSWLVCALASGCGGDSYAVDVTVRAAALLDATLLSVRSLQVTVSGAEVGVQTLRVAAFSPTREERFRYLPSVMGGRVTLAVAAYGDTGALIGSGQTAVDLVPGHTVDA